MNPRGLKITRELKWIRAKFTIERFIAVKTTGIYCRSICPPKPKRDNVEFFTDSISAEKAGYRPCLRCHPEFSPESMSWLDRSFVVQRALRLISQNAMFDKNVDDFAKELGVSSRRLGRLFEKEIGQYPKQISDQHRLNFAQKLISETCLTLTTIAMTAGFLSVSL